MAQGLERKRSVKGIFLKLINVRFIPAQRSQNNESMPENVQQFLGFCVGKSTVDGMVTDIERNGELSC